MPDLPARREYVRGALDESQVDPNPVIQFERWFADAVREGACDANAMALATADALGRPSVRMVLLKRIDEHGLVFATSYESRKGHEIAENARVAVLFYWDSLERQVRVEGSIEKTGSQESDELFQARPPGSRLAARTSSQSQPVASRAELERLYETQVGAFEGKPIERPESWGGYRIVPDRFEFWQGRENRLHDRLEYVKALGAWTIQRLQP